MPFSEAETNTYKAIGANVSRHRRRSGLLQDGLAKKLSLTRSSVANIEAGRQKISAFMLTQLAEIFEISVADLLHSSDSTDKIAPLQPVELTKLRAILKALQE